MEHLEERAKSAPFAKVSLVVANLLPLVFVMSGDWTVAEVMLLYWIESMVVAAYTVARMLVVGRWKAIPLVFFFWFHFGMFMGVHFVFLKTLFRVELAVSTALGLAVLALVLSHGISFARNFIAAGEYKHTSLQKVMMLPYPRMIVMHLVIIFTGFIVFAIAPAGVVAVFLLVIGKTVIDLGAHVLEHSRWVKGIQSK